MQNLNRQNTVASKVTGSAQPRDQSGPSATTISPADLRGPRGRFLTTWKFMRDPYGSYTKWKASYGDTFLVKALNGDVVATCNRENIRRIFALPHSSIGQFAVKTVEPLVGKTSVILVEGQQHREQRGLLSPSFHGETINRNVEVIEQIARSIGQQWQPGQTIKMMDATLDLSLEVIIRIVFGVQSSERVEGFKKVIKQFVSGFHPALAFTRLIHRPLLGLSPWNKFVRVRRPFFDLLDDEIECRRASGDFGEDLLSKLILSRRDDGSLLTNEMIRDQLVTMLLAGHETTQIAIAWAMSWLHRDEKILSRMRELTRTAVTMDSILDSEWLNGVCNESLRLNPVVADVIRVLKKPLELVDVQLPAGTAVAVSICLVHSDPDLYPDPERFDPGRWDGRRLKPHEFLPFGGGIRRCLGATLAILEIKTVVATWLKHFDFELPDDAPEVEPVYRRNITMAPRTGIPLVYKGPIGKAPA